MATENTQKLRDIRCISLIGMAGSGKTTVAAALARRIQWAHMDVDDAIEALYGVPLQAVADNLTKEEFLDMESGFVRTIWAQHTVLSPGGSVVYRHEAMRHLKSLGPVIRLNVPLPVILERIAQNPDRGLAIAPGQTVEDLFRERERLYEQYADYTLNASDMDPEGCAEAIAAWLTQTFDLA